jgi:hypothetical protein
MRFILNRKSEFIINDTIVYRLGGGGGLWWKFEIKSQDRTLSKNNNLLEKSRIPVSLNLLFKVNNMKYWHPHLPFGQHSSVSTLVIIIKQYTYVYIIIISQYCSVVSFWLNCSILCVLIMNVYVAVLSVCSSGPLIGIKNFELYRIHVPIWCNFLKLKNWSPCVQYQYPFYFDQRIQSYIWCTLRSPPFSLTMRDTSK